MSSNYFESLYDYYIKNPLMFEEKKNNTRKMIYLAGAVVCIALTIFISGWLIKLIAGLGLAYFAISFFMGGKDMYNKQSGGKIIDKAIKKFNMAVNSEEAIVNAFNEKNFDFLAQAQAADNQPIQLYINEDATGKTFYLLLRKFFSSSDFRGITDVMVLSGSEYDKYKGIINQI